MSHILDRPVWSALETRHAHLAEGGPLARRYRPAVAAFVAARDASPESVAALAALPAPTEDVRLLEAEPPVIPPGFAVVNAVAAVQMVLTRAPKPVSDGRIKPLGKADAAEMLELAVLTKPGPFTLRAQDLGPFHGVRLDGRLIAMAGERMQQPGYAEVSGICTHPDFRGRGLGKLLAVFATQRILDRGETPYLHAYASNAAAIGLYESIGFQTRTAMHVAVIRAPAAGGLG